MPDVTCPRCGTRQTLGDDRGYRCTSCGAEWSFARCGNCGTRFHMRPGTAAWTCPECGHEHGSATMGDLAPDPEPIGDLEPERPPVVVVARHAAPPKEARPPTRGRLAVIAVLGIAAVLAVSFAVSALGAPRTSADSIAGPISPSSTVAGSPMEALCLHLRDLQMPREDAYARVASQLAEDEAGFQAAGRVALAQAVENARVAVLAYRDALANQADTSAAGAQLGVAMSELPCSA